MSAVQMMNNAPKSINRCCNMTDRYEPSNEPGVSQVDLSESDEYGYHGQTANTTLASENFGAQGPFDIDFSHNELLPKSNILSPFSTSWTSSLAEKGGASTGSWCTTLN